MSGLWSPLRRRNGTRYYLRAPLRHGQFYLSLLDSPTLLPFSYLDSLPHSLSVFAAYCGSLDPSTDRFRRVVLFVQPPPPLLKSRPDEVRLSGHSEVPVDRSTRETMYPDLQLPPSVGPLPQSTVTHTDRSLRCLVYSTGSLPSLRDYWVAGRGFGLVVLLSSVLLPSEDMYITIRRKGGGYTLKRIPVYCLC